MFEFVFVFNTFEFVFNMFVFVFNMFGTLFTELADAAVSVCRAEHVRAGLATVGGARDILHHIGASTVRLSSWGKPTGAPWNRVRQGGGQKKRRNENYENLKNSKTSRDSGVSPASVL